MGSGKKQYISLKPFPWQLGTLLGGAVNSRYWSASPTLELMAWKLGASRSGAFQAQGCSSEVCYNQRMKRWRHSKWNGLFPVSWMNRWAHTCYFKLRYRWTNARSGVKDPPSGPYRWGDQWAPWPWCPCSWPARGRDSLICTQGAATSDSLAPRWDAEAAVSGGEMLAKGGRQEGAMSWRWEGSEDTSQPIQQWWWAVAGTGR